VLILASPGSGHQRFFETLGEPVGDPNRPPQPGSPPDFEYVAAQGRANGIEFLRPEAR
jgi:hypothetical protein